MPDAASQQPWSLLAQPDQRSCGATVLVVARMLADPSYAALIDGPAGLESAHTVAGAQSLQQRFRTEALAMHKRVTSLADVSGRPQVPWPRTFGTPPWAVARQLSGTPAADGTFASYGYHAARTDPGASFGRLLAAAQGGRVSAIFIGSTWIPRHVVLVVDADPTGLLHVFDPARGRLSELDDSAYGCRRVDIAGWDVPWFDVTPDR
jgi:hypothetical protein